MYLYVSIYNACLFALSFLVLSVVAQSGDPRLPPNTIDGQFGDIADGRYDTGNLSITATTSSRARTTPTSITYPPYIRPSVNPISECDIFGPLCQTGSITVALNVSGYPTTVVDCSDYLTAQAISADPRWPGLNGRVRVEEEYLRSFGRSPQCTSLVGGDLFGYSSVPLTFSNCPSTRNSPDDGYNFPAGLRNPQVGAQKFECCGPCVLNVPEVRVFYFPEAGGGNCSQSPGFPSSQFNISSSPNTARKRANSLVSNGDGTVVVSGYTLYVSFACYQD